MTREIIACSIVALFGAALWYNPSDQMMLGALIGAFSTAIGYYLGSSKTETQAVTVENPADKPVPVEGAH